MPAWSTQQLAEFLAIVSSAQTEAAAALVAVERAAEALDAEVAAIVAGGELLAVVGYPEGAATAAELEAVTPAGELLLPGVGTLRATAVPLDHPPGARLVVARAGAEGLSPEEAALLRGMARVASITMRMLRLLDDEAALRRVATRVAGQTPPEVVFATVAEEVGRLIGSDGCVVLRYDDGASGLVMGVWTSQATNPIPVGTRGPLEEASVSAQVHRTGRSARVDNFGGRQDAFPERLRVLDIRSSVGAPIVVDGRVWGAIAAHKKQPNAFPADTEERLAAFTKLAATAISNAQARSELGQLAEEQAALRRVATLVASAASPDDVFVAVISEVRQLLGADATLILRVDTDGAGIVVARLGEQVELMPVGSRWTPEPPLATAIAMRTGRSARVDDNSAARGAFADVIHRVGLRSAVATPIIVDGQVWGVISVATTRESLAADTERRLVDFTELVATAISNAASRAQLAASRARIMATADETRRRIERDLHDGIQQRLVTLALEVRTVIDSAARDELRVPLSRVVDGLKEALDELREISRGVHPANLSGGGLASALKSVARRSALPVALDITGVGRLPQPVEVAAYYTVSEALANAAKHAGASRAEVTLHVDNGTLHLSISDDGVGGADPARGSGIIGLSDRVEALGGTITLISPPGKGTSLVLQLPAAAG